MKVTGDEWLNPCIEVGRLPRGAEKYENEVIRCFLTAEKIWRARFAQYARTPFRWRKTFRSRSTASWLRPGCARWRGCWRTSPTPRRGGKEYIGRSATQRSRASTLWGCG